MDHTSQFAHLDRLVASQAAMNAAHFLALPVLALHLSSVPGIGAEAAGLALGLFLAVARIGPLVTGPLADRVGAWTALRAGLLMRAAGLAAVPLAGDPSSALGAALLLGLGVALHEPAVYGALGRAPASRRDRLLLRHVQALNLGCVMGPGCALVVGFSTETAFFAAAVATASLAAWAFAQTAGEEAEVRTTVRAGAGRVDWRYAAFALSLVPFWALFAQLFAALPILIAEAGGATAWAQSVILVNGLVGFAVVPLVLPIIERAGPRAPLVGGCALAAASVALLGLPAGLAVLIALVVGLSVAETVVTSAADVLTARHADGRDVASRFGLLAVGAGLGTSLGAALGVHAADGAPLVLAGLGALGLLSCAAAFILPRDGAILAARENEASFHW